MPSPGRAVPLQLRLSAPAAGTGLPVLLFSHGFGESMDGYGPLADWWAAAGFVVVQPTYLDSRSVGLPDDDPRRQSIWRQRADDAVRVLDNLHEILEAIPGLRQRTDTSRIVAAGHSFGGQTTALLLGAGVIDPDTGNAVYYRDDRVSGGVLMATAGRGADLSPYAAEHFPFMNPVFEQMAAPALVVLGDQDDSPLTTRGPDWSADPYTDSPGPKHLLILHNAEHSLGGIPGYDVKETTDENPAVVRLLRETTAAYLKAVVGLDRDDWDAVRVRLGGAGTAHARVEGKG
nr:alpha/beta hydrolase [Arthrobacter sp. zg-Y40]